MRFTVLLLAFIATITCATPIKSTLVTIQHSFYADAKKQGIGPQVRNTVVDILSWKINFNALHKNDKFLIVGSNKTKPDAIFFKRKNKTIRAFLWQGNYYNKNGKSLKSGFLKAPLRYERISSKFQLKRYHPVLKIYLPHRAVDYAAKHGTKVHAIADGMVQKRKYIGALGNAIFIKHGNHYQSVYAHLSKFAKWLHVGKQVKKDQVIGYVGSSGRSTGPHLHFEIRYKNKRLNPLNYNPPKRHNIDVAQLPDFKRKIKHYAHTF